ncbi:imidazole glycerol phosphate synthase subunit HisH [Gammaproteobacteria bacterium]|nr:imidazole glycerol phosphate synthase subunit HisH [Gammaproteobacteria bacterium]
MIGIIGYGLGNAFAFANIYKKLDVPFRILQKPEDFAGVTKLILPGVGAFDHAMDLFTNSGMREKVEDLVLNKNMPILGVCVGMQMMANSSEEGDCEGLGWIEGKVIKFKSEYLKPGSPLPHMGWNKLTTIGENSLLNGLNNSMFYFLHSYYFTPNNSLGLIGTTDYGISFCSVIKKNNIYGMQCHPEKSHESGVIFLKNFSELIQC